MHDVLPFKAHQGQLPTRIHHGYVASTQTPVAVIGAGAWGKNLVRCFAELGCLEAVVDLDRELAEALAARHGARTSSFDQVLQDSAIPAVVIATPASSHYRLARLALQAGKHVLVEKPLALRVEDAEELADLAGRRDRQLMVGHVLQYHPAVIALQKLIAEGAIGRVLRIHANRLNLGAIRSEEDVLWCLGPHDLSVILGITGSEPTDITAIGGFHLREGIADAVTVHLSFPGGEEAQMNLSWLHPVKEHRLTVIGSKGMLVFDDTEVWSRKLLVYPHRVDVASERPSAVRAEPSAVPLVESEPLKAQCEHFLNCIRFGSEARTGSKESLRVMRTLSRASSAMRSNWPYDPEVSTAPGHRQVANG